jgi:hypothetical protein
MAKMIKIIGIQNLLISISITQDFFKFAPSKSGADSPSFSLIIVYFRLIIVFFAHKVPTV